MTIAYYIITTLFVIFCILMTLVVLVQKGRGGGLSGAFGGGGGGNTAFGAKTGDMLTWATSIAFGIFLLLAVILNLVSDKVTTGANTVIVPAAATTGTPGNSASPGTRGAPTK